MEGGVRQEVRLERLLKHPLSKEFLNSGYDKEILYHQTLDPMLKYITYDEIAEKGLRLFLHRLLERGGQWEYTRKEDDYKFREVFSVGKQIDEEDNRITLIINEDYTELKIILHKPQPFQENLTENQIWKILLKKGITYGVKKEFILRLVEKPIYEKKFKMALGEKPKVGKDGKVTYYFNTVFNPVPKVQEDGTVDYRELDYVENVKKGTLLCEITPPEKGEDGVMLNGKHAEGLWGKAVQVEAGPNTTYSADKTKIYAACDGSPHLKNGVIEVRKMLVLDNVDISTGNISFAGNVRVRGDVEATFTVQATGDIIVGGIVDGKLYAGGNIILQNGVKGGGRSYLEADKDIRAEFLENTNVLCKGSISADSILNSEVVCWKNISVVGRNGKIIGGKITAGGRIIADEIGNDANTATSLILEMAEGEFKHNSLIKEEIEAAEHMIKQIRLILEHRESISDISRQIIVFRLVYVVMYLENQILDWKKEIENISRKNAMKRSVCAKEILFPNVSIKIEGMFFRNASIKMENTTIRVSNGKMIRIIGREEHNNYEKHF